MSTPSSKAGQLRITLDPSEDLDCLTIRLIGMIDLFSYPLLKKELVVWQTDRKESNIAFDLNGADYVGSAGWAVMFNAAAEADKRGGASLVFGMGERVHRSLSQITARRAILTICKDDTEARVLLRTRKRSKAETTEE